MKYNIARVLDRRDVLDGKHLTKLLTVVGIFLQKNITCESVAVKQNYICNKIILLFIDYIKFLTSFRCLFYS